MSVNPQYDYDPNKSPKLRAYQVESTINFTLGDISHLGSFMNDIIDLGITSFGNAYYALHDEEKAKEDALSKAMENAYQKASRLAATAKLTLDKPVAIEEGEIITHRPIHPAPMYARPSGMMAMSSPQPELPAGIIDIHQDVTVTYQLKP